MLVRYGFLMMASLIVAAIACGSPPPAQDVEDFSEDEEPLEDDSDLIDEPIPEDNETTFEGTIWFDEDHDGIYEDGEDVMGGVRVSLLDGNGRQIDFTVTDGAGGYFLQDAQGLAAYVIEVEAPEGFIFTLEGVGDETSDSDVDRRGRTTAIFEEFSINNAGLFQETITPTPEPEVFIPPNGTTQMTATFSNGTPGCAQIASFTDTFEVTIADEEITMLLLGEGFTYSGTINPDATFVAKDASGFDDTIEGKINPDGSIDAVNTLVVDDCTTTWEMLLTPND